MSCSLKIVCFCLLLLVSIAGAAHFGGAVIQWFPRRRNALNYNGKVILFVYFTVNLASSSVHEYTMITD